MVIDQKSIINELFSIYKSKGFISEEEALDLLKTKEASILETDSILSKLMAMGAIILDEEKDDSNVTDMAQVDYEKMYNEILLISPGLEFVIDYLRATKPPQVNEWKLLEPQSKNNNQYAKQRLFDMYFRVVVRIAYKYHLENRMDIEDAIQEGAIGLVKAIEKFDQSKHNNMASYVPQWIKQKIDRARADKERTIRLPVHYIEKIHVLEQKRKIYFEEYQREPTNQELAEILNTPLSQVEEMKIRNCIPLSLDTIIDQGIEGFDQESFYDDSAVPFELVSRKLIHEIILSEIDLLKPREKGVLLMRLGLDDGKERTLEEVGAFYNVTRERIRQIEFKAKNRLKKFNRIKSLKDFL